MALGLPWRQLRGFLFTSGHPDDENSLFSLLPSSLLFGEVRPVLLPHRENTAPVQVLTGSCLHGGFCQSQCPGLPLVDVQDEVGGDQGGCDNHLDHCDSQIALSLLLQIEREKLHGCIDVGLSVMSVKKSSKCIDLDTEEHIYHLKVRPRPGPAPTMPLGSYRGAATRACVGCGLV